MSGKDVERRGDEWTCFFMLTILSRDFFGVIGVFFTGRVGVDSSLRTEHTRSVGRKSTVSLNFCTRPKRLTGAFWLLLLLLALPNVKYLGLKSDCNWRCIALKEFDVVVVMEGVVGAEIPFGVDEATMVRFAIKLLPLIDNCFKTTVQLLLLNCCSW